MKSILKIIVTQIKKSGSLIVLAAACHSFTVPKEKVVSSEYFYLDVINNSDLDTLCVEIVKEEISTFWHIYLYDNGNRELLLKIATFGKGEYALTDPPVERVYLDTNFTQSDMKELRIVIRNTDFAPDCTYIDIHYDDQWYVKRFYVLNTQSDSDIYIKHIEIDRSVIDEFGETLYCYPFNDIWSKYFK